MLIALLLLETAQQPDCRGAVTQLEMTRCHASEYARADENLNSIYSVFLDRVRAGERSDGNSDEREQRLRAAQRAWIDYRDAQCALESTEAFGGSMVSIVVSLCLKRMTESRASELFDLWNDR